MCALCGAFGVSEHWTDGVDAGTGSTTPFAERQARAAAANRLLALYGLRLAEWGGRFTLTSRTGRAVIVENFGGLWAAAERLTARACDPLDLATIGAVERMAERQ